MKNIIPYFLIICITVVVSISCNSRQKFVSDEWKEKGYNWKSDFRETMVHDLIKSDTLIGMNQEQVIDLLGNPQSKNKTNLQYRIKEEYGGPFFSPKLVLTLIINFDEKGQVVNCKIHKRKRQKRK